MVKYYLKNIYQLFTVFVVSFIQVSDTISVKNMHDMQSSHLSLRYGTSITPTLVRGIIGKLPPHLKIIDPRKFDDEAKMDFAANFFTSRRRSKHLELDGRYPSVSALLGAAEEDLTKLYNWQSKKVIELGYDGLRKYMVKRTTSGTNFHKTVEFLLAELQKNGSISDESCDKALKEKALSENYGYIGSILPVLKKIPKTDWMKLEKATKNHYYCFQGRFDAIVEIEGEPTLVDWKTVSAESYKHDTSSKVNDLKRLYGVPLQVAAYIASVNSDPEYQTMPKIRQGAVVLAYEASLEDQQPVIRPADVVIIRPDDLKEYYKILAEKINSFWWKMMHPKKGDKDINGNINFVFNPALRPPPPKKEEKKPEVIVLEDEVIVDKPIASQEGQNSQEKKEEPLKASKFYAMFESKNNKKATTTEKKDSKTMNKSVFGV
uniref:PD-(D/E)XK endonuclease-like domain-containing protein n=1 Tax=Panagrolaimus sp. ES5 TaxID=591445 RepID=A0AC34FGZ1_9BILA